jgi:hypothetical protein
LDCLIFNSSRGCGGSIMNLNQQVEQHIKRLGTGGAPVDWSSLIGRGAGIRSPSSPKMENFGSISGFPTSGRQPVSKQGFVLDFRDNSIAGVSLAKTKVIEPFNLGADVQGLFNSLFLISDDDVQVTSHPGYQSWGADSCAFYSIPIKGLAYLKISSHRCFNFQLIFSSQEEPLQSFPITFHQERWGTQTLTKTNAAGVADDWTAVSFASSDGSTQLDPATYGDTSIHCGSIGAKNFITTAADNDINLLWEGLNVSGKTWAADPMSGSSGVTLSDGDVSNAQTARYYHLIRLRARVDAAVAATGTAAITSQYRGFAAGF